MGTEKPSHVMSVVFAQAHTKDAERGMGRGGESATCRDLGV